MAHKMHDLLGSTSVCGQTLRVMNKACHKSKLIDQHHRFILRNATTKLIPDSDALVRKWS